MKVNLAEIRERTDHFIDWVSDDMGQATTEHCQVTVNLEIDLPGYHPAFPDEDYEEVLKVLLEAQDESWGEDQFLLLSSDDKDEPTWNDDPIPENAEEIIQGLRSLIAEILEPLLNEMR